MSKVGMHNYSALSGIRHQASRGAALPRALAPRLPLQTSHLMNHLAGIYPISSIIPLSPNCASYLPHDSTSSGFQSSLQLQFCLLPSAALASISSLTPRGHQYLPEAFLSITPLSLWEGMFRLWAPKSWKSILRLVVLLCPGSDLLLEENIISNHIVPYCSVPLFREKHSSDTQQLNQK